MRVTILPHSITPVAAQLSARRLQHNLRLISWSSDELHRSGFLANSSLSISTVTVTSPVSHFDLFVVALSTGALSTETAEYFVEVSVAPAKAAWLLHVKVAVQGLLHQCVCVADCSSVAWMMSSTVHEQEAPLTDLWRHVTFHTLLVIHNSHGVQASKLQCRFE